MMKTTSIRNENNNQTTLLLSVSEFASSCISTNKGVGIF